VLCSVSLMLFFVFVEGNNSLFPNCCFVQDKSVSTRVLALSSESSAQEGDVCYMSVRFSLSPR